MTKKKTEAPDTAQYEALITRLREQVAALSTDKADLEGKLTAAAERKKRPARKFETEKIRVNGFVITVAGKDCDESDAWIERVGDVVVILTGHAADAKRNGEQPSQSVAWPSGVMRIQSPSGRGESYTNLTPAMGASPVGLGPSPDLSPEEKARLMAKNPLEQMADSIVESGGRAPVH